MPKPVKIALLICITIVVATIGFAIYRQENYKGTFVKNVDRELSDEQTYKLQTLIIDINKELATDLKDEDRIKLLKTKSSLLQKLGMLEDAEKSLYQAVDVSANNASVYTDLYELQVEMKNYIGAERSIQRAIKLSPVGSRVEKYAELAKEHLGADESRINQIYLDALDQSGNSLPMLKAYAEYKERTGNFLMARDYWIRIKEKNPENAADYDAHIARLNEQLPEEDRK